MNKLLLKVVMVVTYRKGSCQFDLLGIVMSTTTWPLFTRAGMNLRAVGRSRFPGRNWSEQRARGHFARNEVSWWQAAGDSWH